ncbi:MAG: hypothetical protein ACJ8F3_15715 [Xanthobacteraceae bacterium]
MLIDLRFVVGAVLALALLGFAAFNVVSAVKIAHYTSAGPLETARSVPFGDRADWNQFHDAEAGQLFEQTARKQEVAGTGPARVEAPPEPPPPTKAVDLDELAAPTMQPPVVRPAEPASLAVAPAAAQAPPPGSQSVLSPPDETSPAQQSFPVAPEAAHGSPSPSATPAAAPGFVPPGTSELVHDAGTSGPAATANLVSPVDTSSSSARVPSAAPADPGPSEISDTALPAADHPLPLSTPEAPAESGATATPTVVPSESGTSRNDEPVISKDVLENPIGDPVADPVGDPVRDPVGAIVPSPTSSTAPAQPAPAPARPTAPAPPARARTAIPVLPARKPVARQRHDDEPPARTVRTAKPRAAAAQRSQQQYYGENQPRGRASDDPWAQYYRDRGYGGGW